MWELQRITKNVWLLVRGWVDPSRFAALAPTGIGHLGLSYMFAVISPPHLGCLHIQSCRNSLSEHLLVHLLISSLVCICITAPIFCSVGRNVFCIC